MHRGLGNLPADIGDGEHDAGNQAADRMKPAEKGDDDGGKAVTGGKAEIDCLERTGEFKRTARPAMAPPIRSVSQIVCLLSNPPWRAAWGAEPTTRTWKPKTERAIRIQKQEGQDHRNGDTEMDRRARHDDRQGLFGQLRCRGGKLRPFGSFHGPPTR